MKEIIFYKKQNWKFPVKDFLDDLKYKNPVLHSKILQKIDLLSLDRLWNDDFKYILDKIYELRIKQSTNISRIFYFTIQNQKIVLLDWIIKKNQKLDNSTLDRVIAYKNNFLKNIKL